ncbi:BnaA08g19090D [Brassica napus]|uniref:BnaA08g19090D protein n=1 Tax=Brassica napus TaxID=3708 RepID=A0A078HFE7_BRANA|nr:BnaA08g19090D [Brassica napus]
MHENDDPPSDSVADENVNDDDPPQDSPESVAADVIENDDETNEQELDPDQGTGFVDSKEDMFVDAPEELNFDTPSKEALTTDDDNNNEKEEEEDREKELVVLQEHFDLSTGEKNDSKVEKIQHDDALKELQGIIIKKDEEIAHLATKISELTSSSSSQDEKEQQLVSATDRILLSLSNVFGQEEPQLGSSVSEKITNLENGVAFLSAKYTEFYYGADQLRKCLASDDADLRFQEDFGSALGGACSELLELKEKEASLHERLTHLEDENKKLVEQVNKDREVIESMKAELEQEKTRCVNTKEKLSMAVTKGKALVQNRDALKHQISEKTTELENRLAQLQEKTSVSLEACEVAKRELEHSLDEKAKELEECLVKLQALDEAELIKGELVKSEAMVASYQEMVSSKSSIIENIESILSHVNDSSDDIIEKVRSLVEEREEYNRLKDMNLSIDLPEEISKSTLEARLTWLSESFLHSKDEVIALQNQIERLSTSLSAEMEEKSSIREELDDITLRFKALEETAERDSLEREETVRRLVETSGLMMTEGVEHHAVLVDRSFDQIEKKLRDSSESSYGNEESFEKFQSLLYASGLELSLCKEMLGEGMMASLQVSNLSNELASVKEEKLALETDLERSEEKSALLKDKLSMAIKKGKGLVQDREKLKTQLDEKNSEIEKLMLELQELTSTVDSYKNQIEMLSGDLERTKELEDELVAIKDERDELKQSLSLNDTLLQKVMSIPVDLATEDSSEKFDRLAEYFKEVQKARVEEQEELEKVKEEASTLASKLAETHTALKLVEDALSAAEGNINQLSEENRQVQAAKELVELEMQKAVGEASSLSSELDEACAIRNTLEAALKQAERNISDIISEKEEAQSSTATAEMELEKVNNKLTEAHSTIQSLRDTLTQTESNVDSLSKQIEEDKVLTTDLKNELEMLRNEVELERSKMAEASLTIGSLEEALMKAENSLSVLQGEMVKAEVEKSTLSSKLNVCMEELAGSNGNSQSKSMEIIAHLDNLQMVLKDGGVISRVNEFLERKFKSLRDMDVIARDIIINSGEKGLAGEMNNVTEDDSTVAESLLSGLDNSVDTELENSKENNTADEDEISSSLRKITEGVNLKNKILEKNFDVFSTSIDTLIAALMENMTAARADVINVKGHNESLQEQVKSAEDILREKENTIAALETDLSSLMSVCGDAAKELQLEVKNDLLELVQFQENDNGGETESTEHPQEELHVSECSRRAKELSSAAEKACATLKLFETTSNAAAVLIRDMEDRLKETSTALEKVVLERDRNQTEVSSYVAKVESTEALCQDLKLQLENLKAEEEKWHEKEVELSTLYDKLQEQEAKESLIPASDIRALFDKINGIEMPAVDQTNELDPQSPYDVKKLFAVVDSVTKMQHQIDLLSYEQKELASTLEAKDLEIQGLKEAAEAKSTTEVELVKANKELSKLISGLEKLLGNDPVVDLDFSESWTLLQALERKIASLLLESESSKSKAQELGLKLVSSEKLVEKLSLKIKEFEDKLQSKAVQPDIVHERNIFEAPRASSSSEISEIEDKGKKSISAVPTAAQVRMVRKASTDHLAINIDSESEHLMNNNEADEDKGHVFKSLNMSGLIPTQGKMIADRVDGIWVSGGRLLMSRPQARLGVIVYSLLLHLWLLASIL